ncbi:MAG: M3 family metallopeptidase [Bacteroidia bacterium]|nr:M3 family metallopeptidase [Bacteroidia bacterium]
MINPLSVSWDTPFGTPPFDLIKPGHFREAIEEAIKKAESEVIRITANQAPPSFENTVEALERSGEVLNRITAILFNLNAAETSSDLQAVAQEVSPLLTRFSNDITLNKELFERIDKIFENKNELNLNSEQLLLLEKSHRNFILGGASLKDDQKRRFREISEELSTLALVFDENLLKETNSFELHLTYNTELEGLPASLVEAAAAEAKNRNKEGWIFTLHFPSYLPFMQNSSRRDLRERMHRGYSSRCFRGNEHDNSNLVLRMVNLRLELANMLGFRNYAEMALTDRMAATPARVNELLERLHKESKAAACRDLENIRSIAGRYGHTGDIERWDWAYYSEKLKKELYDFDDELLKPYFRLENVEKAIFELAETLYGLTFSQNLKIPLYHPEVKTFEVYDRDGSFLAILYLDYHPRPGKSGGAWMASYRDQKVINGSDLRPHISIVTNFTRATESRPSLLSFNELTTFLHEFGHALHGMLSKCTYESLSGTNVARDFVELPSQFMENYAFEKAWLDKWAVHYQTGQFIPAEIIKKIKEASVFNEGYACYRQLGFGFLDMEWHSVTAPVETDISNFETEALRKTELEVADSFRKNILEKGGSERPMELYIKFRGKEPSIEPLLIRSGLI